VIGATNPLQSSPGSIRGDFAISIGQNMVHGSDSAESAAREAHLFFPELF
jgi:nucleoside-diphosphate kinase